MCYGMFKIGRYEQNKIDMNIQGDPKKTEPINFFITSTKIKQNNS